MSVIEDILSDAWRTGLGGDVAGMRKTNWINSLHSHMSDDYDVAFYDVGPSLGSLNRLTNPKDKKSY